MAPPNSAIILFPELILKHQAIFEKMGLTKVSLSHFSGRGPLGGFWQGTETLSLRAERLGENLPTYERPVKINGIYSGFPGCCGVAVIHQVSPELINGGNPPWLKLSLAFHEFLLDVTKAFKWSRVLATSAEAEHASVLEQVGFKQDYSFLNNRSAHKVTMWSRNL